MRKVDPNMAIVGPDLSEYDHDIMNELTDTNVPGTDICGPYTDTTGTLRYHLDIIDFHTYPFDAAGRTRAEIIAKPQGDFEDNVTALKGLVINCNTVHERTTGTDPHPLKMAVTETNLEYEHPLLDPMNPNSEPDLRPEGLSAQSFLAGQYWADIMNVGMKHGLEFIAFWSVKEGDPQLGYIAGDANTKLSTYYHYQMLAQNFRGVYAAGTSNTSNVTAFGAKDHDQIVVMLLNQNDNTTNPTPLAYTVTLNNSVSGTTNALQVQIDAGVNAVYNSRTGGELAPESTVMLVFSSKGSILLRRHVYALSNAQSETAPAVFFQ